MKILIDLDNVIADFDAGFINKWEETYPDEQLPEVIGREHFYIGTGSEPATQVKIAKLIDTVGFYADLELMSGAKQAVEYLDANHDVFFVTSPGERYYNAPSEKYAWIREKLGKKFHEQLIVTRAKYAIDGDILIDDKPIVNHEEKASWEHVFYEQSYNLKILDKKRLTWNNYKEILDV